MNAIIQSVITVSNLPVTDFMTAPKHLFAHSDSPNIAVWHSNPYVSNTTEITLLTRTGSYQKSFMIPKDYGTVQDARYDLIAKKITFITDKGIYWASAE